MYLLPLISASAFKEWQTGALNKKKSKKVPPLMRKPGRDFKKDHPVFMVLSICTVTVNNYVVAIAWEFEVLMNTMCVRVIC